MARFNLEDYETVEERIRKFYEAHPDGRIITENLTTTADRSVSTWVVKASIFLTAGEQANNLPKATGLAFEVDGEGMAQKTAALETAETSAIGRCLANAGWSGSKRASRTEMEKAERGVTPKAPKRNWVAEADKLTSVDGLRWLYAQAKSEGATADQLERIHSRAELLSAGGEGQGTD
jgi:hypothetical protein